MRGSFPHAKADLQNGRRLALEAGHKVQGLRGVGQQKTRSDIAEGFGLTGGGAAGAQHKAADGAVKRLLAGGEGGIVHRRILVPVALSPDLRPVRQRLGQRAGLGRQAQHGGCEVERGQRVAQVQGRCAVLLAELFTVGTQHQRRVQIARCGQPEGRLQLNLPRRVVGQVLAAHHVADALRGIVHHHGQLVGPQPVGTAQGKVADLLLHILRLRAQAPVCPVERARLRQKTPGPGWLALQAVAAGAGVDQLAMTRARMPSGRQRQRDVLPRAAAGVGAALSDELLQRSLVERAAGRLVQRRFVRPQAAGGQLRHDGGVGTGHATRHVHVFDAQQPASAVRPRVQPTGQRRHQRAGVQRTGGRGGEAAGIGRWRHDGGS